jgi:membrane protein DedA with SNARE-associated domain
MSFARFTVLTVIGCVPWVLGFTLLGEALGQNWDSLRGSLQYLDYALVLLAIAALGYLLVRRARR